MLEIWAEFSCELQRGWILSRAEHVGYVPQLAFAHVNIPNVRFLLSPGQRPIKIWATERKQCHEVVWEKIHLQSLEGQRDLPGQHLFLLTHHDQNWVVEVLGRAVHMHSHGVDLWAGRERWCTSHMHRHTQAHASSLPPEALKTLIVHIYFWS